MAVKKLRLPALHAAQQEIYDHRARFNVLECGRRFGKSMLGKYVIYEAVLSKQKAAWFTPTYKLMADEWRRIVDALQPIITKLSVQERHIEVLGGGSIDFWSLDRASSASGRGRAYHTIIIDEASFVYDLAEAWQANVRPALTDYRGGAWFLGTPFGRNFFHQLFELGQHEDEPDWKSWRRATCDNPYMDSKEVEEARRLLPDDVFGQEFLGIPADDGGCPFGLSSIQECLMSDLSVAEPVCFGWDLGKAQDHTVGIGLDNDGAVCRLYRWQKPWNETTELIKMRTAGVPALVDWSGLGDPVIDYLQQSETNFEGFKFTAPSKQQIMTQLAMAIQATEIRFPKGLIQRELESFRYEYTPTGVRYAAGLGFHDDAVCALALAVKHWKDKRGITAVPFSLEQTSGWSADLL